ncbi:MAG: hypothetical protein RLP15_13010 [Cryomorphaceae bacterium]
MQIRPAIVILVLSSFALLTRCRVQSLATAHQKHCLRSEAFESDKDSGIVKIYMAGPKGFSDTYQRLMLERYGVEIIKTDLFGLPKEMACYNHFSIPYVVNLHGDTIFENTTILANRMDASGQGDRQAKMEEPVQLEVVKYVQEHLDPALYMRFIQDENQPRLVIYLKLFTDAQGRVYDLYQSSLPNHPIDTALKKIATSLPYRADPALDNGFPAPGEVHVFLRLDHSSIDAFHRAHSSAE